MDSRLVSGPEQVDGPILSRRALIGRAVAAGAALALPLPAMAAGTEWRLAIRNVHNNESVDAVFARSGEFVADGLAELNHGLRDWRTGQIFPMDRKLLALLVQLREKLDISGSRKIDLISGYRSPRTNASLRARGGEHTGVASQSQHMVGKATDIMIPGVSLERLRGAALALGGGGVGYYPRDGFVHVDTGPVRRW
ncbi:MAG: DUF882 domain-containing protein [Pseudomonadota bacterium]|uniref:Murein endopeptidase K n=1 Tax=hydrothermal vent metagenome TaxID=652676 RepID=A0A160TMW2_9ZZZZ